MRDFITNGGHKVLVLFIFVAFVLLMGVKSCLPLLVKVAETHTETLYVCFGQASGGIMEEASSTLISYPG